MYWLLRFGELALPDAKSRDNAWASSLQVPEVTTSQVIVALSVVLTVFKLYQMARPGQLLLLHDTASLAWLKTMYQEFVYASDANDATSLLALLAAVGN